MLYARTRTDKIVYSFLAHPGRLIVLSFLFVILLGSFLLALPWATKEGTDFTYFDALFTATSATCVTGLIVADTQTTFTVFGKIVLICLIQIGGLGLVTITSMFMTFTGRKIGLKTKRLALESAGSFSYSELPILLKFIFGVTFGCEALGAVFLSIAYVPIFGMKQGIIKASFQSISAFCNAGFDLMGNSSGGPYSSLTSVGD
ncbi:MAG: Trk family potassium uptake protein, partial [Clostridiales bacterium]|nr:Trk family potassium uptake protein [Clostridiales bacterium]